MTYTLVKDKEIKKVDANKVKATDFLTESLKLIVTISTIFFGALLAYRSSLVSPNDIWSYYLSLGLLILSAILSVANINSLINKMYRGEDNAIKETEVKVLNILATLSLFIGIFSGAWFLTKQIPAKVSKLNGSDTTIISDSSISVGKENKSIIKVIKGANGKISEVTITPK